MKQIATDLQETHTNYKNLNSQLTPQKTLLKNYNNHRNNYHDYSPHNLQRNLEKDHLQNKIIQLQNVNQSLRRKIDMVEQKANILNNQQYHLISQEHAIEIDKLIAEIARLNDTLCEVQRMKKYQIQRLKQDYEELTHIQINNLKQSHFTQKDITEVQLKKTKQLLNDKTDEMRLLQNEYNRQKSFLQTENDRLRQQIKQLIEKKNEQYYQYLKRGEQKIHQISKQTESKITQMKQLCDSQLAIIHRKLQHKQKQYGRLQQYSNKVQNDNEKLNQYLERERQQMHIKVTKQVQQQQQKYTKLKQSLDQILTIREDDQTKRKTIQVEMLEAEINKLTNIIQVKDAQNQRRNIIYDSQILTYKVENSKLKSEGKEFRKQIINIHQHYLQQSELLKLKMAALHQGYVKDIVSSYETKIANLMADLASEEQSMESMRAHLKEQLNQKYNFKKKYENAICRLNEKLIRLRSGLNTMQNQMHDKLQADRSMMMITSRSLIKDMEVKTGNFKFQEEEIRKLRQLLEMQAKEIELSEMSVEQKINHAANELNRLAEKITQIKSQSAQNESALQQIISNKEHQIENLKQQLYEKNIPDESHTDYLRVIDQLRGQLKTKNDQIYNLKDRYARLQSEQKLTREEMQKFRIESEINHKEAKQEYNKISQKNLNNMKQFYEERLAQLQADKQDLKRLISSQNQKITELINKYKELQQAMGKMLHQNQKKSQLQQMIIQLGMQNNLVKNMVELFQQ